MTLDPKIRSRLPLLAAAAGLALLYWLFAGRSSGSGDLVLQGNVEVRQVNLAFKVAGRIKSVAVDEGDTVRQGQVLASLDKVYFEEALAQVRAARDQQKANVAKMEAGNRPEEIAQAEAAVAEREAMVTNATISRTRAESLLNSATGTRKAYDDALATERQTIAQLNSVREGLRLMKAGFRKEDIEAAKAQLANAEASVLVSERALADADLLAPSGGVVLTRVREAGAIVNAGETVYVLSLTNPVWVRTYVSEPDLARVKPGQPVLIKTDSASTEGINGTIGFISTTAEFTPKTVETRELRTALVYRLRVVAEDTRGVLRQGMPVTVSVLPQAAADGTDKRP